MKHVSAKQQIPTELFTALVRYHLAGETTPELEAYICAGLQEKLNKAAARQRYGENLEQRRDNECL